MPSGPKKRRAQKKKQAAREKTDNEAPPIVSTEENSPLIETENSDGVTVVFDEPSVVLPKRTVLPEKMLASGNLDLNRNDTEEGIKENALPTEIYSSDQSLNAAGPLDTTDNLQDDDGVSVMASDDAAFLVMMDNAVKYLITEPGDDDLNAVECSNDENAVLTVVSSAEDQITLEHKEVNAVEESRDLIPMTVVVAENIESAEQNQAQIIEEADRVDEVKVAVKDQEDAISEDVNTFEENPLEAVAENRNIGASKEVDSQEKVVQVDEVEATAKIQETAISENVNELEKNALPEPGIPQVGNQLSELKEMVEDVLSRLNAIDALLHMN